MKLLRHLIPVVAIFAAEAAAAGGEGSNYSVTILKPGGAGAGALPQANLVGRSIAEILGPVSEVRVWVSGNKTEIDDDAKKVEQCIRERIDAAKCLGREETVPWSKAPWVHGYLLLKDGRIVPVEILLSGIIIGDLLFDGSPKASPAR